MPCSSSMGRPEHRVLHGLVPPDLFRAAAGEDLALMHDHDAVGVFEDDVHVVLDDDRGDLVRSDDRADDVHDGRLLPGAHAAGGLVEEEELRLESVGDRHVEQLALTLRDDAGQLRAMPALMRPCTGSVVMSWPRNTMRPLSGWRSPLIRFTMLVLPAPLEPISDSTSPSWIWKSTLSTAWVSPKDLLSSLVSRRFTARTAF